MSPRAASTLAREVARQAALDLEGVQGSGDAGHILARDVADALHMARAGGRLPARDVLPRPSRSAATEAVVIRCLADAIVDLVDALNEERGTEPPVTVTHVMVKMAAVALGGHPSLHAAWVAGEPSRVGPIDVAVALDTGHGRVAPVVRSAEARSIAEIAVEIGELSERARAGDLGPRDGEGAAITVHGPGGPRARRAGGSPDSAPVATLTVSAPTREPVAADGEVRVASILTLTLSVDRDPVDRDERDGYLADLQRLIEEPRRLLL